MYASLANVLKGKYTFKNRMMLKASLVRNSKIQESVYALNDIVIARGAAARLIRYEVRLDGEYLATYRADGIILATPTGSTAYSLSAGGPIIHPQIYAIILALICPHPFSNRPIVVPEKCRIEVIVHCGSEQTMLINDGQQKTFVKDRDKVVVEKAPNTIKLISSDTRTYLDILRQKLNWGT